MEKPPRITDAEFEVISPARADPRSDEDVVSEAAVGLAIKVVAVGLILLAWLAFPPLYAFFKQII